MLRILNIVTREVSDTIVQANKCEVQLDVPNADINLNCQTIGSISVK